MVDFKNTNTAVFINGNKLSSIDDLSVSWNDCMWANVKMIGVLPEAHDDFQMIETGGEIEVVIFEVMAGNKRTLFSVRSINGIERFMDSVVCRSPELAQRLTMGISFSGLMEY